MGAASPSGSAWKNHRDVGASIVMFPFVLTIADIGARKHVCLAIRAQRVEESASKAALEA